MTKRRTLEEAYAENAKECAQIGHSWIATHPNGPRVLCSWCGARRQESFGEAMQRLQAMAGTTPEELSTISEAILKMAEPEEVSRD